MALATQAFEVPGVRFSVEAGAAHTSNQFCLVSVDSNGVASLPTATGQPVDGVIQDGAASGFAETIMVSGVSKCVAGTGGVTRGDLIKAEITTGKGITCGAGSGRSIVNTSDGGSATDPVIGSYVVGKALTTAAAGELFALLITHAGAVATTNA